MDEIHLFLEDYQNMFGRDSQEERKKDASVYTFQSCVKVKYLAIC